MTLTHPNHDLIALGVRQPWAELIVRGIKTIEVRSQNTNRRGTIYIYAAKKPSTIVPAAKAIKEYDLDLDSLPRGLLVGTVELFDSTPCKTDDAEASCVTTSWLKNQFSWNLRCPHPLSEPMSVRFLPYGVWFYPFRRRNSRG